MNALPFHYLPPPGASEGWHVRREGAEAVMLPRDAPLSWSVQTSCVTKGVLVAGKYLGPVTANDKRGRKLILAVFPQKDFNLLSKHTHAPCFVQSLTEQWLRRKAACEAPSAWA